VKALDFLKGEVMNIDEVKHLEELSNLEFTDDERQKFLSEFDSILEFASAILNASGNEMNYEVIDMEDLREDEIGKSLSQDEAILNAPQKTDGCFVVPRIME